MVKKDPLVYTARVKKHRENKKENTEPEYVVVLSIESLQSKGTLTLKSDIIDIRDLLPIGQEFTIRLATEQTQIA